MRFYWIIIALLVALPSNALADGKDLSEIHVPTHYSSPHNVALIYGETGSFWLKAPKDWTMDNENGKKQGLKVVFYPKGFTWNNAPVVMYVNTTVLLPQSPTLEDTVQYDIKRHKKLSPKVKVKNGISIFKNDAKIIVKEFSGDKFKNHEAVAYMQDHDIIVYFVLSTRNKKIFKEALPDLKALVQSYVYEKISIEELNQYPKKLDQKK